MSIAVKEFAISIEEDISNGLPPGIRVKNEIPTEESEEMSYLKEVGLPTNFGGGTILTKKGEKHTFWCDLCLVELNSLETMTSHKTGQKHLKKLNAYEQQQLDLGKVVDPNTYIRPSMPKQLAPKKIPIRLKAKLAETQVSIVGLKHIMEIMSYSDVEMEPHYECDLCHNQGEANGMFNHLLGKGHREKFLMEKYGYAPDQKSSGYYKHLADKERENDETHRIRTIYSDEQYPWPSGKAPWSLEKGGTGHPPTYGRQNSFNIVNIKRENEAASAGGHRYGPPPVVAKKEVTFHIKGLPPLHTSKDLDSMYTAMLEIVTKAANFHEQHAKDTACASSVATMAELIKTNIALLRNVKLSDELYLQTATPFSELYGDRREPGSSREPREFITRTGGDSPSNHHRRRSRSPSAGSYRDRRDPSPTGSIMSTSSSSSRRRSPSPSRRKRSYYH